MIEDINSSLLSTVGFKLASLLNTALIKISCEVEPSYQSSFYQDFGVDDDFIRTDDLNSLENFSEKLLFDLPEVISRVEYLKTQLPENTKTSVVLIFNVTNFSNLQETILNSNSKSSNLHSVLSFYLMSKSIEF